MNVVDLMGWRYATKRMTGQPVPGAKLEQILDAVRLAPSSYGLQPYRVMVIEDPSLKESLRPAINDQAQVSECSHLLVFAALDPREQERMGDLIQLSATTRGVPPEALAGYRQALQAVTGRFESGEEAFHWSARQAYLALGVALVAAAAEGVDACPMEGFDPAAVDELLGLDRSRCRSMVLLALGYRNSENDPTASDAKVRWPKESLFTRR